MQPHQPSRLLAHAQIHQARSKVHRERGQRRQELAEIPKDEFLSIHATYAGSDRISLSTGKHGTLSIHAGTRGQRLGLERRSATTLTLKLLPVALDQVCRNGSQMAE